MENLGDILKRLDATRLAAGSNDAPVESSGEDENGSTYELPSNACEKCGGRGWLTPDVPAGHPNFGDILTCECQRDRLSEERTARLFRYSNLGQLSRFTFNNLDPNGLSDDPDDQLVFSEAYKHALAFAEKPQGWLVLTGPNGAGKTHLAAALANRCIERDMVVFFVHVPDLLDHLRGAYAPGSDVSYSELLEQVLNAPLLILDGLGSQSSTPWAEEKLQQIINHRYNDESPTVITTASELGELDPYIRTRLRTHGLSRVVEVATHQPEQVHRLGRIDSEMLKRMTFETFNVRGNNPTAGQRASIEAAVRAAKNFADDPDGWLTLFGETGVGKTHLAVAIAEARIKQGKPVFFAFVPELLDYLRYTFTPDSRVSYDRIFDEVKNASLLILDDLGQEHTSPWAHEKPYQIVVHRHN
ncbi:MAG: ATP-binding protein, partial [Chloroflexi bacterium]|nr:ATP-binding protein [Chloroflexota bacterium]